LKNIILYFSFIFLLPNLIGCGVGNDSSSDEEIVVSKDVNKITVSGNGLAIFSEDEKQLIDREIVFEETNEIEVLLTAIEKSSPHSGPMTTEGENFNLRVTYMDGTTETIHLWLYPERSTGRIQKENYEGPVQILSKEDVEKIAKLFAEK
jgi:hypothetical protein